MKLVFYSPILNHHQVFLADEFYRRLEGQFSFVETVRCGDCKGGKDYSERPYLITSWKSKKEYEQAMGLAMSAEVCVFSGYEALPFEKVRLKADLLSFDMTERLLKRGWLNLASPRILKMFLTFHLCGWSKKPLYKLCSGAFVASDQYKLKMLEGKCYKWGYFTSVSKDSKKSHPENRSNEGVVRLMWCGRFLKWKHPEMVVKLAERLKVQGYRFHIDMYGEGEMKTYIEKLIFELRLSDQISLRGEVLNDQIQEAMAYSDIFLLTSDQKEGWGVVANEAMSNRCCLVGSDKIGAIPYLVRGGINGMTFRCRSDDSLYRQVKYLIENPIERQRMSEAGYNQMIRVWNPSQAAKNLLTLIRDIKRGSESSILDGPGSKA